MTLLTECACVAPQPSDNSAHYNSRSCPMLALDPKVSNARKFAKKSTSTLVLSHTLRAAI